MFYKVNKNEHIPLGLPEPIHCQCFIHSFIHYLPGLPLIIKQTSLQNTHFETTNTRIRKCFSISEKREILHFVFSPRILQAHLNKAFGVFHSDSSCVMRLKASQIRGETAYLGYLVLMHTNIVLWVIMHFPREFL